MNRRAFSISTLVVFAVTASFGQNQVADTGAKSVDKSGKPIPTDPTLRNAKYLNSKVPIEERIADLFKLLTIEEKVALIHGCSGFEYGGIPRIGLPPIGMSDGPQGVRGPVATAFPSGIAMAATWNSSLIEQMGMALGQETIASGNRVQLGPGVNIMRTPLGGRNFEYMGEDPVLSGKTAAAYIRGVQSQGAATCIKHYNGNEQEFWRTTIDVLIDERALQEIYSVPFRIAVEEAKPWSVMAAYNKFRGEYATASDYLQNQLLKKEWGFDGSIVSDWGAWHDNKKAIEGGCDIEMPSERNVSYDKKLADEFRAGKISMQALDEAVKRNLRLLFRVGAFDAPRKGSINTAQHKKVARTVAAESMVLLKNEGKALPINLSVLKSIAVIGPNANKKHSLLANGLQEAGGSGAVLPPYEITPLEGLRERLKGKAKVRFAPGYEFESGKLDLIPSEVLDLKVEYFNNQDFSGAPVLTAKEKAVEHTWPGSPAQGVSPLFSARYSGTLKPTASGKYTLQLSSDDGSQLFIDNKLVIDNSGDHDTISKTCDIELLGGKSYAVRLDYKNSGGKGDLRLGWQLAGENNLEAAVRAAKESDVAIVFAGTNHNYDREAFGWGDVPNADKPDLELIGPQADLIRAVAAANPRTIVVLINGAPVSVEQWHQQVAGIVEAWYPGQEGGRAIADVLFGDANPSGKLPCTFGKKLDDWLSHSMGKEVYPGTGNNGTVDYRDSIWVGYRHFDHANIEPRYPFGYGLSYTTFGFSPLQISADKSGSFTVEVNLTNTGSRAGSETVQLYISPKSSTVERPTRELKAFAKVSLKPGESRLVRLHLKRSDFARYEVGKGWVVDSGNYELQVGNSSRHILEKGTVKL